MANIVRGVLGAAGMKLGLNVEGASGVGLAVVGDWAGRISFRATQDGHNYQPVAVTPFPSGEPVSVITGNGTWEAPGRSGVAVEAVLEELTSGAPSVTLSASADGSYREAFLTGAQRYVCGEGEPDVDNRVVVPALNAGPWRLRALVVSLEGWEPGTPAVASVVVRDGSAPLWHVHAAVDQGFVVIPLPPDGLVTTPGNDLVVEVAAVGSGLASIVNAELGVA